MIDVHTALRLHLLNPSDLATLLGGPYVYWPELPAGRSGALKSVVFRVNGGPADAQLPIHRARVNFRCYGATAYEAMRVYRELHDRLVRDQNRIVTDTYETPDQYVAFYNFIEQDSPSPLQDPISNWHYAFGVWQVTVSTLPVAEPTFAS